MVVAASHATLHQIRFFSGDTRGFGKHALTFRHNLRAEGAKSGLHQGSCCSFNPGRGRKLCGRDPQCRHAVLPRQGPVPQPSHSTESLQTPSASHILRYSAKLRVSPSLFQRPSCRHKHAQSLCSSSKK